MAMEIYCNKRSDLFKGCKGCTYEGYQCPGLSAKYMATEDNWEITFNHGHPDCWERDDDYICEMNYNNHGYCYI